MAVEAGASLSTHLENAVPLLLPRHPNLIWDQLAAEELYAWSEDQIIVDSMAGGNTLHGGVSNPADISFKSTC